MELFNILESSLVRMLNLILRFKVQSRVPGPPRDPKKCRKWLKIENQNACISSFTSRKRADDAPKYQVQFSLQSVNLMLKNPKIKGSLKVK